MSNLSNIKTREAIKAAFFTLLEGKSLEKIKILDICERARINRGTFYYHYYAKEDLIHQLIEEYIQAVIQSMEEGLQLNKITKITTKPNQSVYNLFEKCREFASEINMLFQHDLKELFQQKLRTNIQKYFMENIQSYTQVNEKDIDFHVGIKTNQLVFGILYFIENYQMYSVNEFADVYMYSTESTTREILVKEKRD